MFNIDKRYKKILVNIATYISFVFAYLIYGFGLLSANGLVNMSVNFIAVGFFGYIIFEVIISVVYTLLLRFIPNFEMKQKDFKYYLRVIFIFRNIAIALVNIIFIFNPVAAIWGIKISHVLFTLAAVAVATYIAKEKIKANMYNSLMVISSSTFVYLVAFLFMGVIA